jgi:outer membrane protein OmpA-like peptidoglycan-associated protein
MPAARVVGREAHERTAMLRHKILFAAAAFAAAAISTQADAHPYHGYWVRPHAYAYRYYYPYPYIVAPRYVVPVYPYAYAVPRVAVPAYPVSPAPRPPEPRQYSEAERSPAKIIPPPRAEALAPLPESITISAKELFKFDSAKLHEPQPRLEEIAEALKRNPQIKEIHINGYTDRIGTDEYNDRLSEMRANAVKDYFTAHGVAADRIVAAGRGSANPVVQCNDEDRDALIKCLEPNRRVEIEPITVPKR